jgi:hypothetical protein
MRKVPREGRNSFAFKILTFNSFVFNILQIFVAKPAPIKPFTAVKRKGGTPVTPNFPRRISLKHPLKNPSSHWLFAKIPQAILTPHA